MFKVENLNKSFGSKQILKDVSLTVEDSQIVTIIGPSGTGKTTFLRCSNFLEKPDSGIITIDDVTVDASRASKKDIRKLCLKSDMVFQSFNLFKNKTVLQNVTEGLIIVKKLSKSEAYEIAEAELNKVGMWENRNSFPSQISGGQQQRTAIARALAMKPSILLLDEPTSALDPELSQEVLNIVRKIAAEGISMLIVTHEIDFAKDLSDKIVFMDGGVIVEEGTPYEIFTTPKQERTREFINILYPLDFQI